MVRGESHKDIGRRVWGQGRAGAKLLRQKQACLVQGTKSRSGWLGQPVGGRAR